MMLDRDEVRRRLEEAARQATEPPTQPHVPMSAEVTREAVMRMLYGHASARADGRTDAQVMRSAKMRALELSWRSKGIPWDPEIAAEVIAGRFDRARDHFRSAGQP